MRALHADADNIRTLFSRAMSDMYRAEVPQYGTLMELVSEVNRATLQQSEQLRESLDRSDELERLSLERHGAIRLGRPEELFNVRRVFAVMGMHPVGYYDLSAAGVPVHATAFRPIDDAALRRNPFRVFTSLLRLELIEDDALRAAAQRILGERSIFTPRTLELVEVFETQGYLTVAQAEKFVGEALETFRWHSEATVSLDVYQQLHDA
ncbi:2-oxoadipate dioxygenase/decarboxylase family protein, partial [Bradyrhizobium sp.]